MSLKGKLTPQQASIAAKIETKVSENRTKIRTVMRQDQGNIVTESRKKIVQNEAKSPGKNSGKMREKRIRCCKNYPQIWRYERKCEWVLF